MGRNLLIKKYEILWRPYGNPSIFLGWCKAWVTFGMLAFLVAFLAFLIWWREKIIEPDNERLRMAVRAIRRVQEEK